MVVIKVPSLRVFCENIKIMSSYLYFLSPFNINLKTKLKIADMFTLKFAKNITNKVKLLVFLYTPFMFINHGLFLD